MIRFVLFALIISCHSTLIATSAISNFEMPIRSMPEYESPKKRIVGYHNY
jgi:hypothetical protein